MTAKELLKSAEHRVYVDHLNGDVPKAVSNLCDEAEILVNAEMDSDVMLALAANELGRLQVLEQISVSPIEFNCRGRQWFVTTSEGNQAAIHPETLIEILDDK